MTYCYLRKWTLIFVTVHNICNNIYVLFTNSITINNKLYSKVKKVKFSHTHY